MFTKENYNPLLFLSALGPGGMSVTFFMYLMFIVPRDKEKFVIPTFDSLKLVWDKGDIIFQIIIILSALGILFFAFSHLKMLIWNTKKYFDFKKTKKFEEMKQTTSEVTLMALPLTFAMTVNVFFILGAIFIPGLWNIVEYLFPFALLSFGIIGLSALKIFSEYFVRLVLKSGNADFVNNNNLSQMLSVFAFIMVGVGFSSSAAMSTTKLTIFIGIIFSLFFATLALFFLVLKVILGFRAIFEHGLDKEASPSMWIIIPILTLIGITFIRETHGLHEFGGHSSNSTFIVLTSVIISLQIIFGYLGYKVMKANNYFQDFVYGKEKSVGSYALICPGVALVVFSFFFIHTGLVSAGILEKFSIVYFILLLPVIFLQVKTIYIMMKLNRKFF